MSFSGAYGGGGEDDPFDDDDVEDVGEVHSRTRNDHVILLVDARSKMFQPMDAFGTTSFQTAMQAAVQQMKNKVIQSPKHRVGITLFGTKKTSDKDDNNPNVLVLLDLACPNAERIRDIDAMSRGEVSFDKVYGGSMDQDQTTPLRHGLWSCHTEFMAIKQPYDHKRIFLFTNDDDPLKGDDREREKLHIVAKDAVSASIEIKLFHMQRDGKAFDVNKCYRAIVTGDGDDYNDEYLGEGASGQRELLQSIRRKEFKKRRLARLPFYLREAADEPSAEPTVAFDVQLFNMVHPAKPPYPIHLDKRSNRPMQIMSKLMDEKTGVQLDDHEVRTYLEFAGERAYISAQEMARLKALYPRGLTLLGFRPLDTLRPDFNVRSPYFLYPDEESTSGSAKAFISLHAAMVAKKVYALARLTRATGAQPRLVALLAQEETLQDGMQLSPPGFHAVSLPFADEVREPRSKEEDVRKIEVSEQGVSSGEGLIKAMQLNGVDCHQFENPVLQRHYAALQAIALAEDEIGWDPDKHDTTRPDNTAIDSAVATLLEAFKKTYGGDQPDDMPAANTKRTAGGSAGGTTKKVKIEADAGTINWQHALATGQIEAFTLPTLKNFLKNQGLPVAGKKSDLVLRVRQALENT